MKYTSEKNDIIKQPDNEMGDKVIAENEDVQIEELYLKKKDPESILDKLIADGE